MVATIEKVQRRLRSGLRSRPVRTLGSDYWDFRSLCGGVLVSIFFHLLLFWLVPWDITSPPADVADWQQQLVMLLEEPTTEEPEARYVETNPNVPSNEPNETRNFSDRDQQAGQIAESDSGPIDTPFVDGEEKDSPKIIDGQMVSPWTPQSHPPQPRMSPQSDSSPVVAVLTVPRLAAPDFMKQDMIRGDEGVASMLEDPDRADEPVEDPDKSLGLGLDLSDLEPLLAGKKETPEDRASEAHALLNPKQPLPRPRVDIRILPGSIMRSRGHAPIMEEFQVSAKFREFGDYLARMFEAVGFQFNDLAKNSVAARVEANTRVIVQYQLTPDGDVNDLLVRYTDAGRAATLIARDAIQSPAPFGQWSSEMIANLKDEETVTITFLYL